LTRTRLRDARPTAEETAYYERVYPQGYKHDRWPDHVERVAASIDFLRRWSGRFQVAADLSCGDGAILSGLDDSLEQVFLGDLIGARGDYLLNPRVRVLPAGPLPDSLENLPTPVDLYVCSETLEHLDDPDTFLTRLRGHALYLFISTPVDETAESGNLEHYWGWGTADIATLLNGCGWLPLEMEVLVPETTRHLSNPYRYQLWLAVNR